MKAISKARESDSILLAVLLSTLSLAAPLSAQFVNTNEVSLSAGVVRGFPGRTVPVPLFLRHTGTVLGAQFDLNYPLKLAAGTLQPGDSSSVVVRSRHMSPGLYRVLVYPKSGSLVPNNTQIGSVPFTIPAGDFGGGGRVTLLNAAVARTDGVSASPVRLGNGSILVGSVFRGDDGVVDMYLTVSTNTTYVVQATSDFVTWVNLTTNAATVDYVLATDLEAAQYPWRFYRAVSLASVVGENRKVQLQQDGILSFAFPSEPGKTYVLQASTNLSVWNNLATNLAGPSFVNFTNSISPAYPRRFFRVLPLP